MPEQTTLLQDAEIDREAADYVLDFVATMPLSNGKGFFTLQDWQRDALERFYGTITVDELQHRVRLYQYLYIELPKKNGKSELAAALGIYHLIGDGERTPEVYVVAADRDNASIVFNAAVYMIEHHPALRIWAKKGKLKIVRSSRTIYYRNGECDGLMKVLSAEAYSKHGYKPSCVIFDELHAQPNRDLWDVMTFGSGDAREQPVWIVLTTAGDDPDRTSIGWEVHTKALDILRARGVIPAEESSERKYLDDPQWLPIMFGISAITGDDEDKIAKLDIYDETLWRRCNPAIGHTVKLSTVRAEARNAKQSEAAERLFRWLRLNQWISVATVGWLPLSIYDKTQIGPSAKVEREAWVAEHLAGKICYGGLDLSRTTDLTAFTLLFPPQEGLETWVALFFAWRPKDTVLEAEKRDHVPYRDWERAGFLTLCPGDQVDYTLVAQTVAEAQERYDLRLVGMDPALGQLMAQLLQADRGADGAPKKPTSVVTISQGMMSMSPPTKELERLIRNHEMLHVHNTCARWNVGNARAYVDANENIKLLKNRSTGRIDVTVSWIIALATATVGMNQPGDLAAALGRDDFSL